MHRRSALLLELLSRRVMGHAETDPSYQAPLWDKSAPLSPDQQHFIAGLCARRHHHGFLEELILPEYWQTGKTTSDHTPGECARSHWLENIATQRTLEEHRDK